MSLWRRVKRFALMEEKWALTATCGEQPWTLANSHELSKSMNSATMDVRGRPWTSVDMSGAIS